MDSVSNSCLFGAPLSAGPAMDSILEAKCRDLERALARMHLLSSQDALLILRVAFDSCRLLYVMRASNCVDHPALNEFDLLLNVMQKIMLFRTPYMPEILPLWTPSLYLVSFSRKCLSNFGEPEVGSLFVIRHSNDEKQTAGYSLFE